jgi:hypothetical protein
MKNNLLLEKYIKLKYPNMYIDNGYLESNNKIQVNELSSINNLQDGVDYIVSPFLFYKDFNYNCDINANEVFEFTDEIKENSKNIFFENTSNYISIHLRLGDKFLETDQTFVICKDDIRTYNEESLLNFIESNKDIPILFFCDNNSYKLKIKNSYNNIMITQCHIGHTSLLNTGEKQIKDTVTDFYLLSNSNTVNNELIVVLFSGSLHSQV